MSAKIPICISGESFELKQTNKSLEKKIMELEAKVQNLDMISLEKDTLIEKYNMEIKEGECSSYVVTSSVLS